MIYFDNENDRNEKMSEDRQREEIGMDLRCLRYKDSETN